MYVLGISCYFHDSAAALLENGILVAAAEEERFTRRKHDSRFPTNAINFCLHKAGISGRELEYVVFYEKPLLKFQRIVLTASQMFPHSSSIFREAMVSWLDKKLWIKRRILDELGIPGKRLLFVEHHISHAASAFFCSPFDEAAILTVDGVGEWTTATVGQGTAVWASEVRKLYPQKESEDGLHLKNGITLHNELRFPHSLGLLYSAFTAFLGFRVNNGEYKVMGMAPYGRPTRTEDVHKLIDVDSDGGLRLDMDYFDFHRSSSRIFSDKFVELFGPPRLYNSEFFTASTHPNKDHPHWDQATAQRNQHYADIASSIQHVTEETLLKMARFAHRRTGLTKLCMAGGVALNSVAAGRILRESPFDEVFIQPAASDAGGALGAALYAYHVLLGYPRKFVMEHAYWGESYSPGKVETVINGSGYSFERVENPERLALMIVSDLLAGKVVSLFQGRFEWGPRALGNRSILADPRKETMKEIVNSRIKYRELFRPFAPAVLEERAGELYEGLGDADKHYPYRFMLMVFNTKGDQAERIPAVTHIDGSGRIQTIRREWNPLYYRVVELFAEATGVPVVLNTSFNLRGEPIVNTPLDALTTFSRSSIDALYLGEAVVKKA